MPKVTESRMEAGFFLFQVAGAETAGGSHASCSGARAQWLVSVQLTRKVSRCTCVDDSNCPELEVDTLADQQP